MPLGGGLWLLLALGTAEPVKLAAPAFKCADVSQEKCDFYADFLAQQLEVAGIKVISERQLQAMLGLDRQRQLLGCAEDSAACMAELAGALNADGVILGSVARVGSGFAVNVKVTSSPDGKTLAVISERPSDEDAVLDLFTRTARDVAERLMAPESEATVEALVAAQPRSGWAKPAALAGLIAAAGVVAITITGLAIDSRNPGVGAEAFFLSAVGLGIDLIAAPIVFFGGRSARAAAPNAGSLVLRIGALGAGVAGVAVFTGYMVVSLTRPPVPHAVAALSAALGAVSVAMFSIDALLSARDASAVADEPAAVSVWPVLTLAPVGGGAGGFVGIAGRW